jgi:hypothetical protein
MLRFTEQYRYILYLYWVQELKDGEEAGKVIAETLERLGSDSRGARAALKEQKIR